MEISKLYADMTDIYVQPRYVQLPCDRFVGALEVRALLLKLRSEPTALEEGCVTRLSAEGRGLPLLIFCAAGTSAATYGAVAEKATRFQVYAVELPGRGRRSEEACISRFEDLFESLKDDVAWLDGFKGVI